MKYLHHTFWIFGRYIHHGSAAACGLGWLFNDRYKMYWVQSPCMMGKGGILFCRVMVELLNYLFNWEGEKNWFLGFKKYLWISVKMFWKKKPTTFFSLAGEKEKKKGLLWVYIFVFMASRLCIMLSIQSLRSQINLLPVLFHMIFFSMFSIYIIHCSSSFRCVGVLEDFKIHLLNCPLLSPRSGVQLYKTCNCK